MATAMEQGAKPLWVIQAVKNPEERSEVVRLPGPALSGLLLRASCLPPLSQPEPPGRRGDCSTCSSSACALLLRARPPPKVQLPSACGWQGGAFLPSLSLGEQADN